MLTMRREHQYYRVRFKDSVQRFSSLIPTDINGRHEAKSVCIAFKSDPGRHFLMGRGAAREIKVYKTRELK